MRHACEQGEDIEVWTLLQSTVDKLKTTINQMLINSVAEPLCDTTFINLWKSYASILIHNYVHHAHVDLISRKHKNEGFFFFFIFNYNKIALFVAQVLLAFFALVLVLSNFGYALVCF